MCKKLVYDELEQQRIRELEQADSERKQTEAKLWKSQKRARRQLDAITELAIKKTSNNFDLKQLLKKICRLLSETIDVARTSIWLLSDDGSELRCITLYEADKKSLRQDDVVLYAHDFPEYFNAIKTKSRFSSEDVQNDSRIDNLAKNHFKPLGIKSLLDAGIIKNGAFAGVISAAHIGRKHKWHPDEETFLNTMALFVAHCFIESDQKRAEEALRRNTTLLRAAGRVAKLGGWMADLVNRNIIYSDEVALILGKEACYSRSMDETKKLIAPEWRDRVIEAFMNCINTGTPLDEEFEIITESGKRLWARASGEIVKNTSGEIIKIQGAFQDITAWKKTEERLLQVHKLEAIGTLAGGIAHDFNNILGIILGYAQLAQLNSEKNPKVQRYIEQIYLACKRAKELVNQVFVFSRNGKSEKAPVDISVIIKEALKLLRVSIPSTIEIRQNIKSNSGIIKADQTQIQQIIINLCTNAAHAMKKEGGQLNIELTPVEITADEYLICQNVKSGRYIKLTVEDTGCGMDKDTISRIFDPYFTTKKIGEGTGLGLPNVHSIVKDHGGVIKVFSQPGTGTSFHILFPIVQKKSEKKKQASSPLPKGNERILFVDDEKFLVDIGKELLESLGYNVETSTNVYDALELFYGWPDKYDLIITDIDMPKMTGEKLAAKIKKNRPGCPIIACTGFGMVTVHENAKAAGICEILMKPLSLQNLANAVRRVLDETKLARP